MGADQIAAIAPAIAELEDDEREIGRSSRARVFARFVVPLARNPWVEVYLERESIVNLWFPFKDDPALRLTQSGVTPPLGWRITDFLKGTFCTLAFERVPRNDLACLVDALFIKLFACVQDYPLDVEIARFAD